MRAPRVLIGPKNTRFKQIYIFDETGSTNEDILKEAEKGAKSGLVYVAKHQSRGRGRQNRSWQDKPDSSLLVSVLVHEPLKIAGLLPLVAGLAIVDFIEELSDCSVLLKWPNDVITDTGKVAGILVESKISSDSLVKAAIGIGVNLLDIDKSELAQDIQYDSVEKVTGHKLSIEQSVTRLLIKLEHWLNVIEVKESVELLKAYSLRCNTVGLVVNVETQGTSVEGLVTGISDEGHLLVEDETGHIHQIVSGDAHLV